ncbi:unnamed protein product [Malus baccata var. baccata]
MSVEAVEKASPASFLDRREAGFLHFVKYHGLGNDFILVDNRDSSEPKISPEQAAKLCDRNFGIGADGVIFALPGINGTDYTMRIYNSDGSEPEMCGNGVRCFARFIAELENLQGRHSFKVHTGAGLIIPEIQEDGKGYSCLYYVSVQVNYFRLICFEHIKHFVKHVILLLQLLLWMIHHALSIGC